MGNNRAPNNAPLEAATGGPAHLWEISILVATYVLLGLAIAAVWLPNLPLAGRAIAVWPFLFVASIVAGLLAGVLAWPAVGALGVLAGLCHATQKAQGAVRTVLTIVVLVLALALSIHALPGFHNPKVFDAVRFSPNATPFTQYANFDKGAVGLLLLAFFCRRLNSPQDATDAAHKRFGASLLIGLAGAAVTLAVGLAVGAVQFDAKLPERFWVFLSINLLFTCVAEEAFFRGVIQERVTTALGNRPWATYGTVALSAILFGLAHAAGGAAVVAVSTIAGVGYAAAYARSRRIESAILAHFMLNAIHFIGFTYPSLAR
jgi:uncharacterized protein